MSLDRGRPGGSEDAISDAEGRFQTYALPSRVMATAMRMPDEFIRTSIKQMVIPGDALEFDAPDIEIVGSESRVISIQDADGKPMSGIEVRVRQYGLHRANRKTDAEGRFQLVVGEGNEFPTFEALIPDQYGIKRPTAFEVTKKDPIVLRLPKENADQ